MFSTTICACVTVSSQAAHVSPSPGRAEIRGMLSCGSRPSASFSRMSRWTVSSSIEPHISKAASRARAARRGHIAYHYQHESRITLPSPAITIYEANIVDGVVGALDEDQVSALTCLQVDLEHVGVVYPVH